MAAFSQVSQNKRRRDGDWNGGLAFPEAKRTDGGLALAHDSDLMALFNKIDNIDSNPEEADAGINRAINSLEEKNGLKVQTENNIESTDEEGNPDQIGSNMQSELTACGKSKAPSMASVIGDLRYYDDVCQEFDLFKDQFTPDELGIIMNYIDGDSIPDIMYLDAVHSDVDSREVFYGSLWEDDIWHLNEYPVIINDFESPQQEEFGINGAVFHDVWR